MALFGLDEPERQQAFLFVMLLLGGGYLFWQYVWSPLHEERVVLEDRLATLQAGNEQARALTQPSRVAELRQRESEFRVALAAYETMLPTQSEVSALLEEVAGAAIQNDVQIVTFAPLGPSRGENLVELPYDVQILGGYHDIGRFLADVANLPRLVRPVVVSLEATEEEVRGQERTRHVVTATLTLSTFMPPDGVSRGVVPPPLEETSSRANAPPASTLVGGDPDVG